MVTGLKPLVLDEKTNKNTPHQGKNELFRNEQYSPLKSKSFDADKFGVGQVINEEIVGEPEENVTRVNIDQNNKVGTKVL